MPLLNVVDANGNPATLIVRGPVAAPPVDQSGSIASTDTSQPLLPANPARSDWFFQNLGTNPMFISEGANYQAVPGATAANPASNTPSPNATSVMVPPGGTYPPPDRSWVFTGQINVTGTAADPYACLEVSN